MINVMWPFLANQSLKFVYDIDSFEGLLEGVEAAHPLYKIPNNSPNKKVDVIDSFI